MIQLGIIVAQDGRWFSVHHSESQKWVREGGGGDWRKIKITCESGQGPKKRNFNVGWNMGRQLIAGPDANRLRNLHPGLISDVAALLMRSDWEGAEL
jgi:hypothetical protein